MLASSRTTEGELSALSERADGWIRTLEGRIRASEHRLARLTADPASPIAGIAAELRRIEEMQPDLVELQALATELRTRAHEMRTEWLLRQSGARRRPPDT